MKKLIFGLLFLALAITTQAQSPFKGFFKPVATNPVFTNQSAILGGGTGVWLFRPSVSLTAVAVQFGGAQPVVQSLSSVGTGVSYGNFTQINGQPYCNYSVNAILLTSVKIDGVTSPKFGAAITADAFNKLVGAGVGFVDNHFLFLTSISISF
jgi:hypothetical protein